MTRHEAEPHEGEVPEPMSFDQRREGGFENIKAEERKTPHRETPEERRERLEIEEEELEQKRWEQSGPQYLCRGHGRMMSKNAGRSGTERRNDAGELTNICTDCWLKGYRDRR